MNSCISLIFKTFFVFIFLYSVAGIAQSVDSNSYYKVNSIKLIGNKKTKDKIVLRELIKKEKDTLLLKNIARINQRNEYNIFNTQLFIYDSVYCHINDTLKQIDYTIKVKERWYIWPIPFVDFLDRNINAWYQTKDLSRLAYGMQLNIENFTGVKDQLTLLFRTGYANQYGFNYRLPYLNKKQTLGAYTQYYYNELNKLHYVTLYNQQRFVFSDTEHLRTDHSAKVGIFYRPGLFLQHTFDMSYTNFRISDNVRDLNMNYFSKGSNTTDYFSLIYRLTYDNRDNKIYPLKGNMIDLTLVKDGFDVSDASKINLAYAGIALKKYFPIHKRINFATQAKARLMNSDQPRPFAFNVALGYSNYIRGYEYNVIDGQNFVLSKNSLRFQLIKPKFHEVAVLKKLKPFSTIPFYAYLTVFYDGGYVQEDYYKATNDFANSWQHGYGAGLDIITYYDFVMRLEYSFNKQNQGGFFVHLTSGF
jgi:outer membrane protein assembly factor BamA